MDQERVETEVRDTRARAGAGGVARREVVTETGPSAGTVAARVVWYVVGLIVGLLALRFILLLLGANEDNAFVSIIYGLSGIFAAPFFGIFGYQPSYGESVFEVSTLFAILVYTLAGWAVVRLLTIGSRRAEV